MILSPQTIGPFSRQPHSALAAWACNRAEAVFARDPLSMQALATLAPGATAYQAVDVAFALPYDRPPRIAGKPRIGINVSGLLFSGGYTGKNEFGIEVNYAALTRAVVAAFLDGGATEVLLFGHVNSPLPNDDDGTAVAALAGEFPAAVHVPAFTSPSAAKSFISGLDFVVGARMHATIAAYSSGVPVVPISYSRKFEGLFGGLGYDWMVPVRGLTTEAAVTYILDAYAKRTTLAADIARGHAIVEAGLETYVGVLAERFAAAAARR
ncbi:MAG: polysaccharide pyruvyl transferase family protein, partial [Polymorphobacter sp.]